jgi:glutamate:Na+ symporter, ESS family
MTPILVPGFLSFTISIIVFFLGAGLNRLIPPLGRWTIPEAVTGGLFASLTTLILHATLGLEISFDLAARNVLLLYFFTGIGLNARFSDLLAGGKPLLILLALTLLYLLLQNMIAAAGATALGLPQGVALLLGSTSLIGGHGTVIAWAPVINERFNLSNATEIGIASATLGLVAASLIGGPIGRFLVTRHKLSGPDDAQPIIGLPDEAPQDDINHVGLLRAILVMNVAILIGYVANNGLLQLGVKLPLFVACLLCAIAMTNIAPRLFPALEWPARSRGLALISSLSLNIFLSMSLMSMQLWTLGGLGPALVCILALQTVVAVFYILFVVFPAMGGTYDAAVIAAGFGGVSLGATPTAIANMTAVTKLFGAAPTAFIILPLVSAFFIDLANAAAIGFLIR